MKRAVTFFLLFALLTAPALLPYPQEDEMEEVVIKSGFLFNICKFTRWSRKDNPDGPIIVSIIGQTNPGNDLYVPPEKQIRQRKVIVQKIDSLAEVGGSHVLFITGSESDRLEAILGYIEGKDILSMGDTKGYAQRGVCINFYTEKGGVRFEINREAVQKSSIELHAQIYLIGKLVESK